MPMRACSPAQRMAITGRRARSLAKMGSHMLGLYGGRQASRQQRRAAFAPHGWSLSPCGPSPCPPALLSCVTIIPRGNVLFLFLSKVAKEMHIFYGDCSSLRCDMPHVLTR